MMRELWGNVVTCDTLAARDLGAIERCYASRLRIVVAGKFSDSFVIEEIVADTIITAWRRLDELPEDPSALWAWLRETALNHCRNQVRTKVRRERLERRVIDHAELSSGNGPAVHHPGADRITAEEILQLLAPEDRKILAMADSGISHDQAASKAGIGIGAFRMRLHRVRKRLGVLVDELL